MAKFSKSVVDPNSRLREVRPAAADFGIAQSINALNTIGTTIADKVLEGNEEKIFKDLETQIATPAALTEVDNRVSAITTATKQGGSLSTERVRLEKLGNAMILKFPKHAPEIRERIKAATSGSTLVQAQDAAAKVATNKRAAEQKAVNDTYGKALEKYGDAVQVFNPDGSVNVVATNLNYAKLVGNEAERNELQAVANSPQRQNDFYLRTLSEANTLSGNFLLNSMKRLGAAKDEAQRADIAADIKPRYAAIQASLIARTQTQMADPRVGFDNTTQREIIERIHTSGNDWNAMIDANFDELAKSFQVLQNATKLDLYSNSPKLLRLKEVLGSNTMTELLVNGNYGGVSDIAKKAGIAVSSVLEDSGSGTANVAPSGTLNPGTTVEDLGAAVRTQKFEPNQTIINTNTVIDNIDIALGDVNPEVLGVKQLRNTLPGTLAALDMSSATIGQSTLENKDAWLNMSNIIPVSYNKGLINILPGRGNEPLFNSFTDQRRAINRLDTQWRTAYKTVKAEPSLTGKAEDLGRKVNFMTRGYIESVLAHRDAATGAQLSPSANSLFRRMVEERNVVFNFATGQFEATGRHNDEIRQRIENLGVSGKVISSLGDIITKGLVGEEGAVLKSLNEAIKTYEVTSDTDITGAEMAAYYARQNGLFVRGAGSQQKPERLQEIEAVLTGRIRGEEVKK